jgi:CRP-like cAMP-binding protein
MIAFDGIGQALDSPRTMPGRVYVMVLLDKLDKLNFCKGLSKDYLRRLVALGEFRTYRPGDCIFHEGVTSQSIYLLAEGRVALEVSVPGREPMRLQEVEAGELLGWSPLLGLGYMSASALALTPCKVLALDAGRILSSSESDPAFVLELMRRTALTLARRLNATRMQLLEACNTEGQAVS